jgi:hypothetical protein
MTDAQTDMVVALQAASILPGSWDRRFVRSLARLPVGSELSARQDANLRRMVRRYHRQIPPAVVQLAGYA